MAEEVVVHIGENSPEQVAYVMMRNVLFSIEGLEWETMDRKKFLDTYAECLMAVGKKAYRSIPG